MSEEKEQLPWNPVEAAFGRLPAAESCFKSWAVDRVVEKHGETLRRLEDSGDSVDHPTHYGGAADPYEAIKVIEAWGLGFHLGNLIKYVARAGKKTPDAVQDLKKAAWYLEREIKRLGGSEKIQKP